MDYSKCTEEECERSAVCLTCGMDKPPLGRDVARLDPRPWCEHECEGHYKDPKPGHLWKGELADIRAWEAEQELNDEIEAKRKEFAHLKGSHQWDMYEEVFLTPEANEKFNPEYKDVFFTGEPNLATGGIEGTQIIGVCVRIGHPFDGKGFIISPQSIADHFLNETS